MKTMEEKVISWCKGGPCGIHTAVIGDIAPTFWTQIKNVKWLYEWLRIDVSKTAENSEEKHFADY